MKLAIIGSRDFNNYKLLYDVLEYYKSRITLVISGAAPGADTLGAKWSKEVLNIEPLEFPAEWSNLGVTPCKIKFRSDGSKYNALAGFNRNENIIKNCDCCIAFWDGKSPGTKNSISICEKLNKPYKIIKF